MAYRWQDLVRLDDCALGQLDIAAVHLACADGLPGGPTPAQAAECLERLDHYARCLVDYTRRALPTFRARPDSYDGSEGKFRMVCLVRLLQEQFGVRYNEAKIPKDVQLGAADTFIHGSLLGEGGTCASLPVVYAAVGRRLGYPLKLVSTRTKDTGHQFVRWDEPSERFNFEANNEGMDSLTDDQYRRPPYGDVTPEVERWGCLLRSQSPRAELSGFLSHRAHCWLEAGQSRQATTSFAWAWALQPENLLLRNSLALTMTAWEDRLRGRSMPGFPRLGLTQRGLRRFSENVPLDCEREIHVLEAWDSMLDDPEYTVS
ncbi:MAG: hypothetical protein ACRC33_15335 [Gemmataceae bacterium]